MRYLVLVLLLSGCFPTKPPSLLDISSHTVVKVVTDSGTGSGVLIAPDLVLTADHVTNGAMLITVATQDGSFASPGTVLVNDDYGDLAIIKLENESPYFAPLSSEMPPELSRVHTVGFPMGGRMYVTDGRYQGEIDERTHGVSTPIIFGNSGGPVLWFDPIDNRFEVIGIVVEIRGVNGIPVFHMARFRALNLIGQLMARA